MVMHLFVAAIGLSLFSRLLPLRQPWLRHRVQAGS